MKRAMHWLQLPLLKPRQAPMASLGQKPRSFATSSPPKQAQMKSDPDSDAEKHGAFRKVIQRPLGSEVPSWPCCQGSIRREVYTSKPLRSSLRAIPARPHCERERRRGMYVRVVNLGSGVNSENRPNSAKYGQMLGAQLDKGPLHRQREGPKWGRRLRLLTSRSHYETRTPLRRGLRGHPPLR